MWESLDETHLSMTSQLDSLDSSYYNYDISDMYYFDFSICIHLVDYA